MRVLYIWDADYPWDVRVEKICGSLRNHGYEVHIAARNLKKLPESEEIGGVHIHRLKALANEKLNYTISFPLFFSPVWKAFVDRIITKYSIGLIIVRDLPMAVAGIWAGKRHGIPVVFDMAEDYVAMIRDIWNARKFQGLNLLVRNPYLARLVERYVFVHCDHILVVVDEMRDLVLARGGHFEKITIVGNTPTLVSKTNNDTQNEDNIHLNGDLRIIMNRFSVIYTGGIQMGRGIQIVLDAIPDIVRTIPDFLFVIVGDGYATAQLKKATIRRGVEKYVLWVGWVDHQQIFDYIKICKIGIIPHLISDHINTTIPNKIFDYMNVGVPVLASDAVPIKRILDETGSGITFKGGNSLDLIRSIQKMYTSNFDYGKKGIEAIRNKYNWHHDEYRLINAIQTLPS